MRRTRAQIWYITVLAILTSFLAPSIVDFMHRNKQQMAILTWLPKHLDLGYAGPLKKRGKVTN